MDRDIDDLEVYQLHILLLGISPAIWRRVLVRSDSTLGDLHYAIQIAMGWSDDHLHQFLIHGTWYTIPRHGWYGWWVDFEHGRVVVYGDPDTRPHLIGGHGDLVWRGGSFADTPATNLETWLIEGGAAAAMMYTFRQPGLYAYLNHNLIEAFILGAVAHVNVEGGWNNDLMEQVMKPGPINE